MSTLIESYPTSSKPHLNDLRLIAWNYSRDMARQLERGQLAARAVNQTRGTYNAVVWELERMTLAIGGLDCPRRKALIAAFHAIEDALTKDHANPSQTIRNLGNAIMVPRCPKFITFTVQKKGWLAYNLTALYVCWARHQCKQRIENPQENGRSMLN